MRLGRLVLKNNTVIKWLPFNYSIVALSRLSDENSWAQETFP